VAAPKTWSVPGRRNCGGSRVLNVDCEGSDAGDNKDSTACVSLSVVDTSLNMMSGAGTSGADN